MESIRTHLPPRNVKEKSESGDQGEEVPTKGLERCSSETMIEHLALVQIAGADPVLDCDILDGDVCLQNVLLYGFPPTGNSARKFLQWLGNQPPLPKKGKGFAGMEGVLQDSARRIFGVWDQCAKTQVPKQVTIDLATVNPFVNQNVGLFEQNANDLPARVLAFWREGDIALSGGTCVEPKDVINKIERALDALPARRNATLVRAGPICGQHKILTWLSEKKITSGDERTRRVPLHFMVANPAISKTGLDLLRSRWLAWTPIKAGTVPGLEWVRFPPDDNMNFFGDMGLVYVGLRRPAGKSRRTQYDYSGIVMDRDCNAKVSLNWLLRGQSEVSRTTADVLKLAAGAFPESYHGPTGEGRFQLALLSYNICSAIKSLAFESEMRRIPIARFREHFVHVLGQLVEGRRKGALKIKDEEVHARFVKLYGAFRAKGFPVLQGARGHSALA